jgi:hypothetical protein
MRRESEGELGGGRRDPTINVRLWGAIAANTVVAIFSFIAASIFPPCHLLFTDTFSRISAQPTALSSCT